MSLTCEKTPGGSDWQHWIDESVSSCDMLLYHVLHRGEAQERQPSETRLSKLTFPSADYEYAIHRKIEQ